LDRPLTSLDAPWKCNWELTLTPCIYSDACDTRSILPASHPRYHHHHHHHQHPYPFSSVHPPGHPPVGTLSTEVPISSRTRIHTQPYPRRRPTPGAVGHFCLQPGCTYSYTSSTGDGTRAGSLASTLAGLRGIILRPLLLPRPVLVFHSAYRLPLHTFAVRQRPLPRAVYPARPR
jgi:hypothetical protein